MTHRETYLDILKKRGVSDGQAELAAERILSGETSIFSLYVDEIRHAAVEMLVEATGFPVFAVTFRSLIEDGGEYPMFSREIPAKDEAEARQKAEAWVADVGDSEIVEIEPTFG